MIDAGRHWIQAARCLLLLVVLASMSASLSQEAGLRRLLGRGSLAEFPQWLAEVEGLAKFTFRTAKSNGFLFYMDSSGSPAGHYMFLRLREGKVAVDVRVGTPGSPAETLQGEFGSGLGDDQPRSITIVHSFGQFEFELDGSVVLILNASSDSLLQIRSHVFIGGLPEGYAPDLPAAASEPNFVGCFGSTEFANDSVQSFRVRSLPPIDERGVVPGCNNPCAGVDCGSGVCVSRWTAEGGAHGESFCDCRRTGRAGSSCKSGMQ